MLDIIPVVDDSNSDLITKMCWSHVKQKTNSTRIPEALHLGEVYRSEPSEQAELFNDHFFEQFSGVSNYDIQVETRTDDTFDIDFNYIKI